MTFDTGGISIKPAAGMPLMKGDMGGAACVAATMLGIAALHLPIKYVCKSAAAHSRLVLARPFFLTRIDVKHG